MTPSAIAWLPTKTPVRWLRTSGSCASAHPTPAVVHRQGPKWPFWPQRGSGAEEEGDADAADRPEAAGQGADDEALGGDRGLELVEPPEPLDRDQPRQPPRPAGEHGAGDGGALQDADPGATAQHLRVRGAAPLWPGPRVGGPQH